ncbi:hypothetical protein K502DRAFT_326245 [Neoconidiobolus thromboides FSU 785]|nr:hypothetical protein K502DRAFT_326245 [Neoconidiobolus thromboides FSU 785]
MAHPATKFWATGGSKKVIMPLAALGAILADDEDFEEEEDLEGLPELCSFEVLLLGLELSVAEAFEDEELEFEESDF